MSTSTAIPISKEANKHLSEYDYSRLAGAFMYQKNFSQIGRDLNLLESTVRAAYKRLQKTQTTLPKTSTRRKRVLSQTDLNAISQSVRRRPTESISAQYRHFSSSGKKVSLSTFRLALARRNFKSRVAAKKPALKKRHKKAREAWVKERLNWTKDDWNKVVWSDEAKFALKSASAGTRVIRKDGERYEKRHIKGTHKFGLSSVMVWGCFHANGVDPLVVHHGSIDQKVYVQCLVDYYLPWIEKESEKTNIDYILQEDNAPCHLRAYSRWYKMKTMTNTFDRWPSQSPDLNPIENVLGSSESEINTLSDLKRVLKEEWYKLTPGYLNNLVSSMSRRCKSIADAHGGHTKY